MRRVEFRCEQELCKEKPENWTPVIAFEVPGTPGKWAKFICDTSFVDIEHAKRIIMASHLILTTVARSNEQMSPGGDLPSFDPSEVN